MTEAQKKELLGDVAKVVARAPKHVVTVGYTSDDDGIHLTCSCKWSKCIGFNPTITTVIHEEQTHLINPAAK